MYGTERPAADALDGDWRSVSFSVSVSSSVSDNRWGRVGGWGGVGVAWTVAAFQVGLGGTRPDTRKEWATLPKGGTIVLGVRLVEREVTLIASLSPCSTKARRPCSMMVVATVLYRSVVLSWSSLAPPRSMIFAATAERLWWMSSLPSTSS